MVLISDTPTGVGIYRRDRNEDTRSTVVSKIDEVARINRATIALKDRAVLPENGGHSGPGEKQAQAAGVAGRRCDLGTGSGGWSGSWVALRRGAERRKKNVHNAP